MSLADQGSRHLAEKLARESYGRLLAIISARSGDVIAAEDALADAFAQALTHWPKQGVPDNPEAWLVVTARRRIGHAERHGDVQKHAERTIEMLYQETHSAVPAELPDERLKLLFVCAHPAIAPAIRTPLMLQTVLGLDAEHIGQAFLVPGPTMGQRLVRAKSKIRDAGVPFAVPDRSLLPQRLQDVLNAIYAAFNTGWDDLSASTEAQEDLADEAIYLAQLVVDLMPDQAEALGLLALMLYSAARRNARRDDDGRFVPLSNQDSMAWDREMILNAETALRNAANLEEPGRYQTEAAIQSVHASRLFGQQPDPTITAKLYDVLATQTSSIGVAVSRAAAHLAAGDPETAQKQLNDLSEDIIEKYQPYWVVKAKVHLALDQLDTAIEAYAKAIELTQDDDVRKYLEDQKLGAIHS